MTVKELIELLSECDKNMEIVMQTSNSIYVHSIKGIIKEKMIAHYGENRPVLVMTSNGQEGAV